MPHKTKECPIMQRITTQHTTTPVSTTDRPVTAQHARVYGLSEAAQPFATRLGIQPDKMTYFEAQNSPVCLSSRNVTTNQVENPAQVAKIHQEINTLLPKIPSRSQAPDIMHLHVDHPTDPNGHFKDYFDKLEEYAKTHSITIQDREDSLVIPEQYKDRSPHIVRTSDMEVVITKDSTVMAHFIDHATQLFKGVLSQHHIDPKTVCLFAHPQYSTEQNNPKEQYVFHYQHMIVFANLSSCIFSYNYAVNIKERLQTILETQSKKEK